MSVPNLEETKIGVVINAALQWMLLASSYGGYTFDSVEVVPYVGLGEVIAYKLWVHNPKGEKVLAHQDIISISICHGERVK